MKDNRILGKFTGGPEIPAVMTVGLQQLLAASALIITCEKICASGVLPDKDEQALRLLIIRACKAFEVDTLAERGSGVVPFPGRGAFSA